MQYTLDSKQNCGCSIVESIYEGLLCLAEGQLQMNATQYFNIRFDVTARRIVINGYHLVDWKCRFNMMAMHLQSAFCRLLC